MTFDVPFATSRIVVVSDFNCPYCFTLNEWLGELGLSSAVHWVGIEHRPSLPREGGNSKEEVRTLSSEVADVLVRAPEVGVVQPSQWRNSHDALLLQNAVEYEAPELAPALRRAIFHAYWKDNNNISDVTVLQTILQQLAVDDLETEPEYLEELTEWWRTKVDRIPCMIAPTGVAHLGLQTKVAVESFINSALHDATAGPGCGSSGADESSDS